MRQFFILLFLSVVVFAGPATAQSGRVTGEPSGPQLRLEFNRSPASAIQLLESRGYSEVKILNRDLLALRVEACREGERLEFSLRLDGRVFNSRRVGSCRARAINQEQAREIARAQGLTRIVIERTENGLRAIGCDSNGNRVIIRLSNSGRIENRRRIGRCDQILTIAQVATILTAQGFTQLEYDEGERRPPYSFQACEGRNRFGLVLSGTGQIQDRVALGLCERQIELRDLPKVLGEQGFDRIEIVDGTPPNYVVRACRRGTRYDLIVGGRGEILEQNSIGPCRDRVDLDALKLAMEREGFYNIEVKAADNRQFSATACYGEITYGLIYNRFGDPVDQVRGRSCRPMRFAELRAIAEARGVDGATMVLEGCRGGRAIVSRLDRNGIYTEDSVPSAKCQ
ncbi:MAG: hypothetical protein AAFY99_05960 [Pseudomonadota bacterium]